MNKREEFVEALKEIQTKLEIIEDQDGIILRLNSRRLTVRDVLVENIEDLKFYAKRTIESNFGSTAIKESEDEDDA
jgi:hypothetical protein